MAIKVYVKYLELRDTSAYDVFFTFNESGSLTVDTSLQLTALDWSTEKDMFTAVRQAISDWANIHGYPTMVPSDIFLTTPILSGVAKTGSYNDLIDKPSLITKAYEGTTARTGAFSIFKTGTVASGIIAFHLTNDGLSTGTALFPNGVIADSVNVTVSDATASYQMSWAFTNSNKTLTITANKLTTSNILTGILGQAQANGSVIKLTVWGY